jgi:hypothetical protein
MSNLLQAILDHVEGTVKGDQTTHTIDSTFDNTIAPIAEATIPGAAAIATALQSVTHPAGATVTVTNTSTTETDPLIGLPSVYTDIVDVSGKILLAVDPSYLTQLNALEAKEIANLFSYKLLAVLPASVKASAIAYAEGRTDEALEAAGLPAPVVIAPKS